MSCTQFHCIKMFILRHAWLNLWDKHMTTGRINQVTTIKWEVSKITQRTDPSPRSDCRLVFHNWYDSLTHSSPKTRQCEFMTVYKLILKKCFKLLLILLKHRWNRVRKSSAQHSERKNKIGQRLEWSPLIDESNGRTTANTLNSLEL